jgi:hypothetical protein
MFAFGGKADIRPDMINANVCPLLGVKRTLLRGRGAVEKN